jgi:hypothetical protein
LIKFAENQSVLGSFKVFLTGVECNEKTGNECGGFWSGVSLPIQRQNHRYSWMALELINQSPVVFLAHLLSHNPFLWFGNVMYPRGSFDPMSPFSLLKISR